MQTLTPPIAPTPVAAPRPAAAEQFVRELDTLTEMTIYAKTWLITQGPAVLLTLILFVVGYIVAGWLRKLIIRTMGRARIDITLAKFLGNLTRWAIIIFAIVACLGTFGINTTSFAALIAAAGLAIGLALQGNLSNLASGVLLLVFRPFKIGDSVVVAGRAGVIDGIDLFTTALDTADYRRVIVPNGAIVSGVIENQTHHPKRRIDVLVTVNGGADFDATARVFNSVLEAVVAKGQGVLKDPGNVVNLAEVFPAVVWEFNLWCETPKVGVVRRELLVTIRRAMDSHNLSLGGPGIEGKVVALPSEVQIKS